MAAELRVLFLGVGVEGGSPEPRVEAPPWVCVCVWVWRRLMLSKHPRVEAPPWVGVCVGWVGVFVLPQD